MGWKEMHICELNLCPLEKAIEYSSWVFSSMLAHQCMRTTCLQRPQSLGGRSLDHLSDTTAPLYKDHISTEATITRFLQRFLKKWFPLCGIASSTVCRASFLTLMRSIPEKVNLQVTLFSVVCPQRTTW